MKLSSYTLIFIVLTAATQVFAAAPVITVNSATSTVHIAPNGNTASSILDELAKKAGFKLTGKMEKADTPLNQELDGNIEKVIHILADPQSIAVIYSGNENGPGRVSKVELLPTGKVNATYPVNAADGAPPLTGSQDQIENRIKHNDRRELRRTQKIQNGDLVWTPEGRKKLEERFKKLDEQNANTQH